MNFSSAGAWRGSGLVAVQLGPAIPRPLDAGHRRIRLYGLNGLDELGCVAVCNCIGSREIKRLVDDVLDDEMHSPGSIALCAAF